MIQNSGLEKVGNGRDHNVHGFCTLLAGGGVKGGITYGATDDFGFKAAENKVPRSRSARDDSAPDGHRPQAADLSVQRPGLPADGRRR